MIDLIAAAGIGGIIGFGACAVLTMGKLADANDAADWELTALCLTDDLRGRLVAQLADETLVVRNDPRGVGEVLDLGKATYRKMVQNLWWAAGYNVVAIPLAAGVLYPLGVLLSPAVGAVLMSLSTIIVAFNARRLKAPSRRPAAPIPAGSPRYRA